jgi:glyoxylase-like metal-dependent hydrolase (beta-lactamase superfamily II)
MIKDPWFTIQQIDGSTYAISEYGHWEKVHSFLLVGEEEAVLIDTGLGIDSIKRITDQLTELPIKVFTTHVHTDHIGNHREFENIYVHEYEKDWLVNGRKDLSIEEVRKDLIRDVTISLPKTFNPNEFQLFQGEPAGLLKDGDVIEMGNRRLAIYHTPGHSPGHVSIFDKTNGYLFTGDLLYDETPIYAYYPSTNPVDLVKSLEKISAIPNVSIIFGSHNTLGLKPDILEEVKRAVQFLRDKELTQFGTGIHTFNGFSVQF